MLGTGNFALDIIYQRKYPEGFDTAKKRNPFVDELPDKLFIRTMGENGMEFNLCGQGWKKIAPVPNPDVVDWEGAGDWTTSVFIAELCKSGKRSIADLTEADVCAFLNTAAAIASRSVGFMGSKGMIEGNASVIFPKKA